MDSKAPARTRVFLLSVALLVVSAATALSQEQDDIKAVPVEVTEAFSPLSTSAGANRMVIILVTNDPAGANQAGQDLAEQKSPQPWVWCEADFQRVFYAACLKRNDLASRVTLQRLAAGRPAELSGGTASGLPGRVMLLFCDVQYGLLNVAVGLPDADLLIDLIEETEENRTLLNLHHADPVKAEQAFLQRSIEHVDRAYRQKLASLVADRQERQLRDEIDGAWLAEFGSLARELAPVYRHDVQLRFALTDRVDQIRLLVLEQHCETRSDWCQAISPFIVGRPTEEIIQPLIESVWQSPAFPNLDPTEHDEVLSWFRSRRENDHCILTIKPDLLYQDGVWPPPELPTKKRSQGSWRDLETEISKHPNRSVDAQQLAVLIREQGELPVVLHSPARTRYIIYVADNKMPFVIHEMDRPMRFVNRLK